MATIRNIGIITSGGDSGGLNAVIHGAAHMGHALGMGIFVIPNGYAGLYNLVEYPQLVRLDETRVDGIRSALAGSEAGHSRVKISKIPDEKRYERILAGLEKCKLDGLVISGGDDTGSVVVDLVERGVSCIHAPKTMDLDLQTYSVGGDSAINRIARIVEDLKTTGRTHNRIVVTEVFGRYAGHTAFRGGIAADSDAILIPEIPVDFDILYRHAKERYMRRVAESDVDAGTYSVVVAEGLRDIRGEHITDESAGVDAFGHKKLSGAGKYVRDELTERLEADDDIRSFMKSEGMFVPSLYEVPEVREVLPGHLVRAGISTAYDVNFGKQAGAAAVMLLSRGLSGMTIAGVDGTKISYLPTREAIKQRHVDLDQVAFYEQIGVCFGRDPAPYEPELVQISGRIERHL